MTDSPTTPEREAVARLVEYAVSYFDAFSLGVAHKDISKGGNRAEYEAWQASSVRSFKALMDKAAETALAKADAILARGCPEGWRPIETAPKDDEPFLAFVPHARVGYMLACCCGTDGQWRDNLSGEVHAPTHWMPLPAAPQPISGGE